MGDELCDRFAPPEWLVIDQAWERGEISLPNAQKKMWAMIKATSHELLDYATEIGPIRAGFDSLLKHAQTHNIPLVLASGGFDFYITHLLGDRANHFENCYYNHGVPNGVSVDVSFPCMERMGCTSCAVCKGMVCRHYRAKYGRVVFIGDGTSDRCALGEADQICAVRHSKLAGYCREAGMNPILFDTFDELLPQLIND